MAVVGRIGLGPGVGDTEVEIVIVDHDPKVTPTNAATGSIIIRVDTGEHFRKLDDGSTTNVTDPVSRKDNLNATTDPTATDDSGSNYSVGSIWVNLTSDEAFICVDSTLTAAIWKSLIVARTVRTPLRNETGGSIPKGTLVAVAVAGFSIPQDRPTVVIADKDEPTKRPAIAVTEAAIPNNTNFEGLVLGLLTGLNTSAFSENDQLALSDAGAVSRPPPDTDPFTGEIQLIGSVVRSDASDGSIYFTLSSGLLPMTAAQFFVTKETSPTGIVTGGEVTRAAGLNVDVASGTGFVNDDTNVFRPTWIAVTNLLLPANNTNFIFVDKNGLVQSALSLPDLGTNIILATAITDGASVLLLSNHNVLLRERPAKSHQYAREVVGNVTVNGVTTSKDAIALRLQVDAGTFYSRDFRVTVPATDPITFTYWFRDGVGGFTQVAGSTLIDKDNWDDGDGGLNSLVAGEFKKDLLFVVFTATGAVEYHVFYGQEVFTSQSEAESGNLPAADSDVIDNGIRSGGIVIEGASATIASVVDVRPFIGQLAPGTTAVSDHGLLSGLADDDHSQYQLRSEEDAANGYAGLDGSSLLNAAQVPDGADATAIHDDVANEFSGITEKAAPVDADLLVLEDSEASGVKKRLQIGNLPGGVTELFSGYDAAGGTVLGSGVGGNPTAFVSLPLDSEHQKTSGFTHAGSSAEVTINAAGKYIVNGSIGNNVTSGIDRSASEGRLMLDTGGGFVEVGGTRTENYNRTLVGGGNDGSFEVILDLEVGDILRMEGRRLVGNNTVVLKADGTALNIYTAGGQGAKGDTGDVGEAGGGVQSRIHGLVPSNAADADHDMTISLGAAVADDNEIVLLVSALTKQIDAAWAVGNNLGGLFSGAVANDTWYHIFLIRKDSDGSIDAGFDTSPTAANIPAGYSSFKRVGSVLTNGSANILAYAAEETAGGGLDVIWANPPLDANEANSSTADLQTLSVPPDVKVWAQMNVRMQDTGNNQLYMSSPDANDEAASLTAAPLNQLANNQTSSEYTDEYAPVRTRTNTSSQIRWRSNNGGGDRRIATLGWEEARR